MLYDNGATSVKNQSQTGTCWDFATQSFLESELLRMGKGKYNLSEMFNVRYTYPLKAEKYVRYHGKSNSEKADRRTMYLKYLINMVLSPILFIPDLSQEIRCTITLRWMRYLKMYLKQL